MKEYLDYLKHILDKGVYKGDRTGTGTTSVFGYQMRFDLQKGFPLVTTKKIHLKSIIHELLWFIKGETNIAYLKENGVSIWDEWARDDGSLGPVYGKQWRNWETKDGRNIDQLAWVINRLKTNPDCRRIIVSAWNVGELEQMALMPCHAFFQFWSREMSTVERVNWAEENGYEFDRLPGWLTNEETKAKMAAEMDSMNVPKRALSCLLYQRSCDSFLGVPFNIASYALLTMMVAQVTNMVADEFIWTGGDCHIYSNHMDQINEQLKREPHKLPTMRLNPAVKNIDDFKFEDFTLENYTSHAAIKGQVAV